MPRSDPLAEFQTAVADLTDLTGAVARQESHGEVVEALTRLRLAITRVYGTDRRPQAGAGNGARPAILQYLVANLNEWVSGDELAAVSGIGEWARRVRELRVELGYEIEEDRGNYRLLEVEPNHARRERWLTVTAVRDEDGEPVDRVRALFVRLLGEPVTADELNRVAHSKEGARLARGLRELEQWPIEAPGDASDLHSGEHRLVSAHEAHRLDPSQRMFSEDLRGRVFRRDRFTCWSCGQDRARSHSSPADPFYLVVRHLESSPNELATLSAGRLTDMTLLATSCSRCMGR
ncbi:hypothetical protein [Cellulomonas sp. Leaf334]|uniref:hypothetical protein n=1 Tax=Cellulomonas sp. Leaf334 TaxID=1736339 RepID=UPI0006F5C807|nr:hypothetical protein [Cellulomonas sp. Leaf334]KQR10435.1 hypothetical protein ASF78_17260 [Cellulomonas sp. Leaf334]